VFWWKNRKQYPRLIWEAIAAAIFSRGIVTEVIRFFCHRPRPFVENHFTPLITDPSITYSFPSGHASFYFAIGTVLYFYNKKAGILFLLGSAVIGVARVFAGVHWFSDVVGGALIGIFSGWLVCRLLKLKVNKQL
jgi:undecaprenyl-diphosphatase